MLPLPARAPAASVPIGVPERELSPPDGHTGQANNGKVFCMDQAPGPSLRETLGIHQQPEGWFCSLHTTQESGKPSRLGENKAFHPTLVVSPERQPFIGRKRQRPDVLTVRGWTNGGKSAGLCLRPAGWLTLVGPHEIRRRQPHGRRSPACPAVRPHAARVTPACVPSLGGVF